MLAMASPADLAESTVASIVLPTPDNSWRARATGSPQLSPSLHDSVQSDLYLGSRNMTINSTSSVAAVHLAFRQLFKNNVENSTTVVHQLVSIYVVGVPP